MKKIYEISLLFFLSVTLCSCPYSSPYYLDEKSSIYVEDALLGKWIAFKKIQGSTREEEIYLTLTRRTDTDYNITFTDERQFFNIRINARNYIAEMQLKGDKLSLLPLAEGFTAKMIFNTAALRKSVEVHYKTRVHPLLDDDFCLHNMVKLN